jgi:hypothetical protein
MLIKKDRANQPDKDFSEFIDLIFSYLNMNEIIIMNEIYIFWHGSYQIYINFSKIIMNIKSFLN